MIDRIFKNWKTSALGLFIILFTLALVWFEKQSLLEVSGFWGVALVLLYTKDPRKKDGQV